MEIKGPQAIRRQYAPKESAAGGSFRRRRTLLAGGVALVAAVLAGLFYAGRPAEQQETDPQEWKRVELISLGIEKPGVQIAEFERNVGVEPNPAQIRVTSSRGSFTATSLQQFRGLVHIDSLRAALRFVRFRTSRRYTYNWRGDSTPQEIVSFSQRSAAAFADTGGAQETGLTSARSGWYGLLSDRAYRTGGFQPPVVRPVPGGYRIVRWVCVYIGLQGAAVEQWQEDVGPDGDYKRTVLKTRKPPKLPDTTWYIAGLK